MKVQLPPDFPPEHMWDFGSWDISLAALEAKGYKCSRGRDDLDSYWFTEIEDEEIGKILLILRDNPPIYTGFDVLVRSDVFTADALTALRRHGAKEKDIILVTKHPHYPGPLGELLDPPMTEADRDREYQENQAWFYRELEKQKAQQPRARAAG